MVLKNLENLEVSKWAGIAYRWAEIADWTVDVILRMFLTELFAKNGSKPVKPWKAMNPTMPKILLNYLGCEKYAVFLSQNVARASNPT